MAEKKISITLRAIGKEDKTKRISLSPSDGVIEVVERSKKLFLLTTGDVRLKAMIGTDVTEYDIESQEDRDVLQDAEKLIIYLKEVQRRNDKLVCIDGEEFYLDELPISTSKLVWKERYSLIHDKGLAIPSMVTELDTVKDFLYVAYYSTKNCKEIHNKIEQVGSTVAELCDSSLLGMGSFILSSEQILARLQDAFINLFEGQDKMAASNFKTIPVITKKMLAKLSELQEMFGACMEKVRDSISCTRTERSEQLETEEGKMKQTIQEGDTIERELLPGNELIGDFNHQRNEAKHPALPEEVAEGKKDLMKHSLEKSAAFTQSKWGLKGLYNTMHETQQIFRVLLYVVDDLASRSDALKEVYLASVNTTICSTFKIEAITCIAKWVALKHIFSSHMVQINEAMKGAHEFLCENPTWEKANQKMTKIRERYERQLQQTRVLEDDPEEESLPPSVQQVDPEASQVGVPSSTWQESTLEDTEEDRHPVTALPHVGPKEGSPATDPLQAPQEVNKEVGAACGLQDTLPPPDVKPKKYSFVVKQDKHREIGIKDTQHGGGEVFGNTTRESNSPRAMQGAEKIPNKDVSRRNPEQFKRCAEANLYVKNLDASIDEVYLRRIFRCFGEVTREKVMRDENGDSKGVGFVCYSSPEEAEAAIQGMNGSVIEGKTIVVEHKQPKKFKPCEGANLFVNNLDINIDEDRLKKEFGQYGSITSATIWSKEGVSQGFGFVCYRSQAEAVKAIKNMDGEIIENKPVSVELAQKKEGRNVYVNHLEDNIDDFSLHRIFKQFGEITSVKVMRDEDGKSKGYGFVCFSTQDEAKRAIERRNGEMIQNRPLYVNLHLPQKEGANIYVYNLADDIDSASLYREFEQFGLIRYAKVMVDSHDGSSKGFGFVSYSRLQEAHAAIEKMNGKIIQGKQLYVDVAESRAGKNVYVNNLARYIDDKQFCEAFDRFGTITNAKVKTDWEGNSMGFGFVCYSSPKEAAAAIEEMNGSILENLVLYVALAQPPQRREYLK